MTPLDFLEPTSALGAALQPFCSSPVLSVRVIAAGRSFAQEFSVFTPLHLFAPASPPNK